MPPRSVAVNKAKDLRILMLEDSPADVVLINRELHRGGLTFHSKRVETRDEFIQEIDRDPPDVILSDHGLPSFDGFSALAVAKDKCPDTPFIFVTGSVGEEVTIDSLRSGATDYVLKDRLPNLVPAVQRALHLAEERTLRKQAERELRESEERFRLLIGGVKDYVICMLDPEGRVSSWNTGAEMIAGYATEEIIGRHFGCFYRPEEIHEGKPERDLKAAAGDRFEDEGWRVRKDGSQFRGHTIITALRDESGLLKGFTQVMRDVTERWQAQEQLRKGEERYRNLIQLCPDALLVLVGGKIVFINIAVQRLFGTDRPDLIINQPMERFIHADGREAFGRFLRDIAERGSTAPWIKPAGVPQAVLPTAFTEKTVQRLDGTMVVADITATRLTFQDQPAIQIIVHDITERERNATALRESEARKTAMLETSLDAIICIDHEGVVQEWNTSAERIFGYPRNDAIGRRFDDLVVPPALKERYLPGLANYLMTGVGSLIGRPIELVARKTGGEEFPVELAITRDPNREPPLFTAFIRDITDRKRAERALRQSEARKTAILETALDAIVSIDQNGKIIEWNPAAEQVFGYSREFALGREMAELIVPPALVNDHRQGLAQYLKTGRGRLIGQRQEMSAIRANGAEFPVEIAITQISGEGPSTFTGFIRDITGRRRAETALRRSEERFRLLVEGVEDYAIYMLDTHGRVVTWNTGAERIEGHRMQEIVGRKFGRFYQPEDCERGKPEEALAVATAEGRFQDECWQVRKDGSRYWATIVITALRDEGGKLSGFSVITRDISRWKAAEDEIHKLNTNLERRVDERTAELQEAYHEMESFSYSISHDLRAPLIHIGGFAELLKDEAEAALNEKARNYLQTIRDSTRRMGRMIDDLLAFSRTSRMEMHKVRVNMAEIVKSVQGDLQPEVQGRAITWVVRELPDIQGDPFLLRQAVLNLVSNALKYTRKREEARIEIGSKATSLETVFFVRDNGVGFDMNYAGKLFGVFQRLHSTAEFEGTGIGLANVRRIIKRHGGRTWAEAAVDGGATFYFSLPDVKESRDEL